MIKIIKPGTKKIKTCENCGCEFSYEAEDVIEKINSNQQGCLFRSYIVCPQCHVEIGLIGVRGIIKEKSDDNKRHV